MEGVEIHLILVPFRIFKSLSAIVHLFDLWSLVHASSLLPQKCPPVNKQSGGSQHTQTRRQRLPCLDRARKAATGEEEGSEQSQFHAVGLAFRDTVASKAIQQSHSQTGGDAGDGTCSNIAGHSTD